MSGLEGRVEIRVACIVESPESLDNLAFSMKEAITEAMLKHQVVGGATYIKKECGVSGEVKAPEEQEE